MTSTTRKRQPIDAFIARKADIDTMLERLGSSSICWRRTFTPV